MHKNENTQNSHSFLALAFFRGICLNRHQRIWNQHKILRFLIPILIFFKKKFFWVIIALFAYFKCKCEKNCTFSNILQKVKSYFFANIYHSPCDSYWNSKKSIKLKPPIEYTHFIFNKRPIYTHDGASVKFSTNSHETDYSVRVAGGTVRRK